MTAIAFYFTRRDEKDLDRTKDLEELSSLISYLKRIK